MIIKNSSQIINEIIKFEKKKIDEFDIKISHAPTIGKQYEGMTINALNQSIPSKLNLRIISGFVKNSKKQLSGQIDCMICFGDGELVPGTRDEYIYEIRQVLAVIEIKKNLFSTELKDSYEHLLGVNDLICDYEDISSEHMDIINTCFAKATGVLIRSRQDVESLNNEFLEMIYHGLVSQFIMPLRIVIGYGGFSTEKSLREKFISFIELNSNKKGFGPFSFPNLILCGKNCLVKLSGEPYSPIIENNYLEFFASSSENNIRILTELIFSRISRYATFDFSEDDKQEQLKYYLGAKLAKLENRTGWEYTNHPLDSSTKNSSDGVVKWQPVFVSQEAHIVFNYLCKGEIDITGDFFKSVEQDVPDILEQLQKTRLAAIGQNKLYLITYNLKCMILPTGEYVVADDNYGYFDKWLSEFMYERKHNKQ